MTENRPLELRPIDDRERNGCVESETRSFVVPLSGCPAEQIVGRDPEALKALGYMD